MAGRCSILRLATCNTGAGRTAFAGNLIPIERDFAGSRRKILAAFPAPQSGSVLNNLIGSGSGPFTQNSFDTRIDYAASSSINVFGRFSLDYFKLVGQGPAGRCRRPRQRLARSVRKFHHPQLQPGERVHQDDSAAPC